MIRRCVKLVSAWTVTLWLAGCASVNYKPVQLDSPPISIGEEPCAKRLYPDAIPCKVLVKAALWATTTGIMVETGESYCVQVPAHQVWFDLNRRNTPPFGERGSWLMRLATKRHSGADFFSLIVNTRAPVDGTLSDGQAIEIEPRYKARDGGEIVFYPNDARGSPDDPEFFYRNNAGQIWVTVQRCEGDCVCKRAGPRP